MGCYGDAAKRAFDNLFPLGIGHTHFLGVSENFCSQIISSRTDNMKYVEFFAHFSE